MSEALSELVIAEDAWETALPEIAALAERAATLALDSAGLDPSRWSLCILATSDAEIARLNGEFRGKPEPTNVLSWPAFDLAPAAPGARPEPPPIGAPGGTPGARTHLGDVAIALQTVAGEAEAAAIPLKDHFIHLILHGSLHLLGFDHRIDADAETMERIEVEALARIGVPDPYSRGSSGQRCPD